MHARNIGGLAHSVVDKQHAHATDIGGLVADLCSAEQVVIPVAQRIVDLSPGCGIFIEVVQPFPSRVGLGHEVIVDVVELTLSTGQQCEVNCVEVPVVQSVPDKNLEGQGSVGVVQQFAPLGEMGLEAHSETLALASSVRQQDKVDLIAVAAVA